MAVLRTRRSAAPSHIDEARATVRHASVISRARAPIDAIAARLRPAPVSTIDGGIILRGMPRAPAMTCAGSRTRLRTAMPATIAKIAALRGYRTPDAAVTRKGGKGR